MRIPRLYSRGGVASDVIALDPELARRISRVLRLRDGARVDLFDGKGNEVEGVLAGATVEVTRRYTAVEEGPEVHLYPALIRANRFDWLVEKTVELGATEIHPVRCARSIVDEGGGRLERWRRIAVEAAEQSERRIVPAIHEPVAFADGIRHAAGELIVAWEAERAGQGWPGGAAGRVSLFSGPEGGYTEDEIALAREAGATTVGLGPFVLRAETAAIALVALVRNRAG